MKGIYLFFFFLITLFIFSCTVKEPTTYGKKPPKDDFSSLRKHLAFHEWRFLPLNENETLVSYSDTYVGLSKDAKLEKDLAQFCKANGGKPILKSCWKGKKPIFKSETFRGFGISAGKYGTFYLWFTVIKTEKPDIDLDYGFYNYEIINYAKNKDIIQFIKENKFYKFDNFQKIKNGYKFELFSSNPKPPEKFTSEHLGGLWTLIEFCRAHNGKIYGPDPITKGKKLIPFNKWIIDFLKNYNGYTYRKYIYKYYLSGDYICDSKEQPFFIQLFGNRVRKSFDEEAVYTVLLQTEIPEYIRKKIEN